MTKEPAVLSIYDCWTKPNQWLSLGDIVEKLGIKSQTPRYCITVRELTTGARLGIFDVRPRRRKLKGRITKKGNQAYFHRVVKEYKPKEWILRTVCNGFFEKRSKELDKELKR